MTAPGIILHPRGVGRGGGYRSLVTGEEVSLGHDMAMFASNRADAYTFAEWVAQDTSNDRGREARIERCYIDYRPSEPNWLQVKVVVEDEHEAVLDRLYNAITLQSGYCDEATVNWAIDPEHHKEPHAMRLYDLIQRVDLIPPGMSGGRFLKLSDGPRYYEPTPEEREAIVKLAEAAELSPGNVIRQALRLYQLHHSRLAAGETVSWSGDAGRMPPGCMGDD